MITFLSLVTSVKDYVEIVHKLIEFDTNFKITNYEDFGSIITYIVITLKELITQIVTLKWLSNLWSGSLFAIPIIIPDISSAMVSEVSVLDGYLHNAFNFLDKPLPYGETNLLLLNLEKFSIGLINSLFLFIPTGTSHLITIRRFVMQGLEAGYLAGLGSIFGNILWITSVIFGFRFFVIPWVSLDIFRYILGFVLLVKYMWESANERKMTITSEPAKQKIFILNFLLALTEQTSIYPFLTNLSIGSESSIFESFPSQDLSGFLSIHCCYIFGLTLGCLSLLQLTCWFWENPAFQIYMWLISSFKVSTTVYYKVLNFTFLYLTMICAISSIPYYGLDYTLTNPLGLVQDDRILYQTETLLKAPNLSFLGTKASDRNTRRNRGRHGRRERWKRRIRKYRTFDASLYDQGVYDLFTIEDLNYGFDRFWLRRKMRNHRVRFRFFPGSWMRSFKKQLAKPRLESYAGPRQEFFRILFEQIYHPSFHVYSTALYSSKDSNVLKKQNIFGGQSNARKEDPFNIESEKNSFLPSFKDRTASKMALNKNKSFFLKNDAIFNIGLSEISLARSLGNDYSLNQQSTMLIKDSSLYSTDLLSKQTLSNPTFFSSKNSQQKEIFDLLMLGKQSSKTASSIRENLKVENSTLRKFVRKLDSRLKMSQIKDNLKNTLFLKNSFSNVNTSSLISQSGISSHSKLEKIDKKRVYSKRWKHIFSKINHSVENSKSLTNNKNYLSNFYGTFLSSNLNAENKLDTVLNTQSVKKQNSQILFGKTKSGISTKDLQILKYRSLYLNKKDSDVFSSVCSSLNRETALSCQKNKELQNNKSLFFDKNSTPFTLFHSLKFYQKKQEAFEKKLHYYTPTVFRKFSIENNAPYFRVMMKRYFYYYKPTLRWERTMKVASLRKARRKTPSNPRKIQLPDNLVKNNSEASALPFDNWESRKANFARKTIPTHNYTIVGKRASRYRYQIYKDVLQHWYYTPFNRLLLKFDIDLFINRQPNSHFLTKNEENLLHLRRFLLSEHYNSLRWYTQMEHYRSMKTNIGGTKSFVSGIYNQQFSGTFKKIRHLFAITPSQTNQPILKFDQPLYNEYYNNSTNYNKKNLIIHAPNENHLGMNQKNTKYFFDHEELLNKDINLEAYALTDNNYLKEKGTASIEKAPLFVDTSKSSSLPEVFSPSSTPLPNDLVNQSTQILGNYLASTKPIKQEYIKKLLEQKNYGELTNFLYKGQKTRGFKSVTNYSDLLNQEKDYLFTNKEVSEFKEFEKTKIKDYLQSNFQNDLWVNLLKKWKRKVNDQEFLKNYLQRRVEKREKRKTKKQKNINLKLKLLYFASQNTDSAKQGLETIGFSTKNISDKNTNLKTINTYYNDLSENQITTGVQKSLNEGLQTLNTTNNQKNSFDPKKQSFLSDKGVQKDSVFVSFDDLKYQLFLKQKTELKDSLKLLSKLVSTIDKTKQNDNKLFKTKNFKSFSSKIISVPATKMKNFYKNYQSKVTKILKTRVFSILTKAKLNRRYTNFKTWQKKERTLNKQKRMRKEFKQLSKNPFNFDSKNYSKYLDQKSDIPLSINANSSSNKRSYLNKNDSSILQTLYFAKQNTNPALQGMEPQTVSTERKALSDSIFRQTKIDSNFTDKSLRKKRDYSTLNASKEAAISDSSNKVLQQITQTQENLQNNKNRESSLQGIDQFSEKLSWNKKIKNTYLKYFQRKFKRKKSPQRRVRVRKNRAVIKKRTLNDSLKREFQNLKRYNQTLQMDKAQLAASSLTGGSLGNQENFKTSPLQRRAKQKKQRFWKQKRSKYSQKYRKYKKRRRSVLGKIRILNKQLKKVKVTNNLKFWWWNSFLPNLRATTDSLWQYEKDRQIQQKLLELSMLSERDKFNYKNASSNELSSLLIGDFDYKPFAIGGSALLSTSKRDILHQNNPAYLLPISDNLENNQKNKDKTSDKIANLSSQNDSMFQQRLSNISGDLIEQSDMVSRVAKNYLLSNNTVFNPLINQQTGKILTNPIPFYAGWDESLRKFVVTNRLLSRRDSGYEMNLQTSSQFILQEANMGYFAKQNTNLAKQGFERNINNTSIDSIASDKLNSSNALLEQQSQKNNSLNNFSFTSAPLKGMNTATTLYWQIPFTTYDPDQFFALGMDGFAPLGWKRFQFRHSILKSWLYEKSTSKDTKDLLHLDKSSKKTEAKTYVVKNKMNLYPNRSSDNIKIKSTNLINKLKDKNSVITIFQTPNKENFSGESGSVIPHSQNNSFNKNTRNIYRRLKKRYRRVKKHPRSPVWFPSGPLLNQVLPVHYIYIFYKRSRLPRDRYLKRRLVKSKTQTNLFLLGQNTNSSNTTKTNDIFNPSVDFTLRKRVKTKRKYHIKQDLTKQNTLIPRRVKFISDNSLILRWRPVSRQKINKPISELIKEKRVLRSKQKKKELQELNSKQPTNIRIKQLRRRVQRQIIRSVWRYKPHAGGFVWPGDYLKLELIKAPKLELLEPSLSAYFAKQNTNPLPKGEDLEQQNSTINNFVAGSVATSNEAVLRESLIAQRITATKVKRKKKRNIQDWQIQQKKYLLQKHNYNVIKKKLAKAQRLNKIPERIKELTMLYS